MDLVFSLQQEGLQLSHLDIGGGWGIRYGDETSPEPDFAFKIMKFAPQSQILHLKS